MRKKERERRKKWLDEFTSERGHRETEREEKER